MFILFPSFSIRHTAHQVKAAIRREGFKIRQSFGEAGAALAYMLADENPDEFVGILTDSSDFLVFENCRCIPYTSLELDKESRTIDVSSRAQIRLERRASLSPSYLDLT